MKEFEEYLQKYEDNENYLRLLELLGRISKDYPFLTRAVKWNQPMFINNNTFIIGFSCAKKHISVAVEKKTLDVFASAITNSGYSYGKMLFQIKIDQELDYNLLQSLIEFNIKDKEAVETFWRK